MQNGHQYILEPYKTPASRYTCPSCGKHKQLTRYINVETNKHLSSEVGKCNRDINCGYHYTPKQFFQDNTHQNPFVIPSNARDLYSHGGVSRPSTQPIARGSASPRTTFDTTNLNPNHNLKPLQGFGVIPPQIFKQSLSHYHANNFTLFLTNLFGTEITSTLITKYYIGTSKHWNGSTVFWQIDTDKIIRTGKIMLYNPTTGKRVKQPFNHITWVHTVACNANFSLRQCLFGEHLLKDTSKSVAIVESEKTAIIASVYLPNFIWLGCGSLTNITKEKCQVLSGRKVILYPDLKCLDKWNEKAKELSSITNFTVSDFLEKKATDPDKQSGLDLADYLICFNHNQFDNNTFVMPPSSNVMLTKEASVFPASHPEPVEGPHHPLIKKIFSSTPNILDHFELSTPKPIPTGHPEPVEGRPEPVEGQHTIVIPRTEGSVFNSSLTNAHSHDWSQTISALESFFTSTPLPTTPVKINNHTTIIDASKFIASHLRTVKKNNGNKTFLPYLERLQALQIYLKIH